MSKKNDDFFKTKKSWSEVKDQLLGCYFKPYVQKILRTSRPLIYVDCFAGKGRFDDGKPGSPLIALDIIRDCLASTKMLQTQICSWFIDLNYSDDLRNNLKDYLGVKIISGKYEEHIMDLLKESPNCNIFLYIDPYGIKALQSSIFDKLACEPFYSIELLINLNSFGFIREACHAMKIQFNLDDFTLFDDLVEYDATKLPATAKSIQDLNEIAGGDYWQRIILDYKEGRINGYKAEELFAEQYCQRLAKSYKYVLNMPLRIKPGQRPKYRMIHATNHHDGCLLMVDNIFNRWESWQNIQSSGQLSLFQEDLNNHSIDEDDIRQKVMMHYSQFFDFTSLNESMAKFFMKYGLICKTRNVKDALKELEKKGKVKIYREPPFTKTGRPSEFMEEKTNKQKVMLKIAQ